MPDIIPHPQPESHAKGLVVILTGNGKGKTSGVLATILRDLGRGIDTPFIHAGKERQ